VVGRIFASFLIFFLLLPDSQAAEGPRGTGDLLYKKLRPVIFQAITSVSESAPKSSYGTAFVLDGHKGWLITNYHVVATALQDDDQRYKIFLNDQGNYIPAEVLDIDVVNDLALLAVKKTFPFYIQMAKSQLKRGEKIFSLGLPKDINMSIVEGTYNGPVDDALYPRIHMSSPINQGMSGGPSVNQQGELVGVNVSTLGQSQNVSFSVPVHFVKELVERYQKSQHIPLMQRLQATIAEQMTKFEKDVFAGFDNYTNIDTIDRWHFFLPKKYVRCWADAEKDTLKTYENEYRSCSFQDSIYLDDDLYGGFFKLKYRVIKNFKRNRWQYYKFLGSIYNKIGLYSFEKEKFTPYRCGQEIIVNKNQVPFKINFCLREYIKFDKTYSGYWKALSLLPQGNAMLVDVSFTGFSADGIKKFFYEQLSSIKLSGTAP
jgi:serine protease Do